MEKDQQSYKMPPPARFDGLRSLILVGLMAGLALAGYWIGTKSASLVFAILYGLLWLGLIGYSQKKDQWLPLLVATTYWLVTSAIRLFLSDESATGRKVGEGVRRIADFASAPLESLASLHPDLPLLVMAAITLLSLMGLIMILDRSKPKTRTLKDGSSDQTDWF